MFKFDRNKSWPPRTDLSSSRATLSRLEREMRSVPQFADITAALNQALNAIDKVEAKAPQRLTDRIVTTSRFRPPSQTHPFSFKES